MIVITGSPGTGKTTLSKLLAVKLKKELIHSNDLVKEEGLSIGEEGDSLIVDMPALEKELRNFDGIVEGLVLCELPLSGTCIVLRTAPEQIAERLAPRNYSEEKVRENQEAEALDYCTIHALDNYTTVIEVITTDRNAAEVVDEVIDLLKKGEPRVGIVDYSNFFD